MLHSLAAAFRSFLGTWFGPSQSNPSRIHQEPVTLNPDNGAPSDLRELRDRTIRIPNLAGAIVIKSRAATVAQDGREKHERDLARLLALVPDVVSLRAELTAAERGYMRAHRALLDVGHPAWRRVDRTEDGVSALTFIIAID